MEFVVKIINPKSENFTYIRLLNDRFGAKAAIRFMQENMNTQQKIHKNITWESGSILAEKRVMTEAKNIKQTKEVK